MQLTSGDFYREYEVFLRIKTLKSELGTVITIVLSESDSCEKEKKKE